MKNNYQLWFEANKQKLSEWWSQGWTGSQGQADEGEFEHWAWLVYQINIDGLKYYVPYIQDTMDKFPDLTFSETVI